VSLSIQKVSPGALTTAWKNELQRCDAENVLQRFWNKDSSLWPAEEHQVPLVKSNLLWLDLPARIEPCLNRLIECTKLAEQDGLDHFVFVSMGASNLAAAAILNLPNGNAGKRTYLLDTTDPAALCKLEIELPIERTLFVFSNKSGKRFETHALLLYFLEKLKVAGIKLPGKHFVALTEEGSYLATLAKQYKFRAIFCDPPGVLGRYSGLIHFSFFLSAVTQVDKAELLESICDMRDACGPSANIVKNPAVAIAALLSAAELRGFTRLVLLTGPELNYFAYRIAHLVGTSTSGNGRGLIPIFAQASYAPQTLQNRCVVVILTMKGQARGQLDDSQTLRDLGIPLIEIELHSPSDLAAEIFKWEIATALACVSLHVNCFHDGESRNNLNSVAERLKEITEKREPLLAAARANEDGISLYVEGETRRLISTLNLRAALQTFLELRNPNSYIVITPFFWLTPEYTNTLRDLRDRMRDVLGMPVQVSTGPRYLHALGSTYKQGPPNGLFIGVTADPAKDVALPGAGYTFGDLQLALALTEFEALEQAGRRTIRLHLSQLGENSLKQLADVAIQAVAQIRRFTQEMQA
jgi:transaldolase / glucose-6-phosphate isomerase